MKYPRLYVRGVGWVDVTRLPKKIPKTIKIGSRVVSIAKVDYLEAWALTHQPHKKPKTSFEKMLKLKAQLREKSRGRGASYKEELEFSLGYDVRPDEYEEYESRGFTAEQAAIAIREKREKREEKHE